VEELETIVAGEVVISELYNTDGTDAFLEVWRGTE
jgi:hypothetical protein